MQTMFPSQRILFSVLTNLFGWLALAIGGHLEFNPDVHHVSRLAGQDVSFFITCLPQSSFLSPIGDSQVRAKQVSWTKQINGNGMASVIATAAHARIHVEESTNGRGLDLIFRSITSDDNGSYTCSAVIDGETIHASFRLDVIEPISFEQNQNVQTVEEGAELFLLNCGVFGQPKPQVTWNVRGQIIHGRSGKYESTGNGLIIRNITKSDSGVYKCKAVQFGKGITDFKDFLITLKVDHTPEFSPHQRNQFYGFISGMANLTCLVNAEPPAKIKWLDKTGTIIEQQGRIITHEEYSSSLMFQIDHDDAFGEYVCAASNKMGTVRKTFTLLEGAKPGVPSMQIYKIGPNYVHLIILENRAELFLDIIGFQIEVKEKDENEDWEYASIHYAEKNNTNQYMVTLLHPKSVYVIRARATNFAGTSDPSNMIVLQTKSPHVLDGVSQNASAVIIFPLNQCTMFLCLAYLGGCCVGRMSWSGISL